ncbi:aldose 1-epimerase [Actinotignum sp. GS-2025c]|uniref:aldose 1-epimerase n=1 Tax=Actinotignum sp. GS-2025c TaxID=3427276 RepID=UPI003F450DC4
MIVTTERECAGRTVTLRAATRGVTLLSYRLGETEVIDGYRNPAELRELNGFRSAVLVPWSNRIRAGRYPAALYHGDDAAVRARLHAEVPVNGVHSVPAPLPDTEPGLHGLVTTREFEVIRADNGVLEFAARVDANSVYPFELAVNIVYSIGEDGSLHVHLRAENLSEVAAPVALGWHPYFRLAGPLEDARLSLDCRARIATDAKLIPYDGAGAFAPCEPLADSPIDPATDWAYARLADSAGPDAGGAGVGGDAVGSSGSADGAADGNGGAGTGWNVARLHTRNREVALWARLGDWPSKNFHIFAGSGLARDAGQAVAMEPCQALPNAFNRAEGREMLLEPGASRELEAWVVVTEVAGA